MALAPTSSTTAALVMGDALAVALMESRQFQQEDFARFHPGGSLGRKLLIKVKDLMRTDNLPFVNENASFTELLLRMSEGRLGMVVVGDHIHVKGIITDGDLSRHMSRDLLDKTAGEVMTRKPKIAAPDQLAAEALAFMNDNKITRLFVLDPQDRSGRPVGILHIHDCLRAGIA